jgi:hypothetical protein
METPPLPAATPLRRREQSFIVLLALLQGLLLYLAEYADEQGWPVLSELRGQVPWYTLVLIVPSLMQLMLLRLDDRRFWSNAALAMLAFGAMAAWATWSVTAAAGTTAGAVLGPFGATMALTAFIALPYLQVRLVEGRFLTPYAALFALAWQNALSLGVVGVVVGVGWGLLVLWQELFQLIGIGFFKTLFRQDPFIYLVTGLLAGLGVLVARTQLRAMQVARQVLFAIFTGFLPLAAFIAVLFLLSLPFTGLAPLQRAASTAFTLSSLVAALVLLLNAVVQTGRASPYPRPLRWLVDAAMLALPLFAGIALHAVLVRIGEHGWTSDRFWALIAVLMLGAYSLGYAWAVLQPGGAWMTKLPRVNVAVSLALIALGLLANSPLLDPHRIAVASQRARIEAAAAEARVSEATRNRIEYLRFDSGRRGLEALAALAAAPGHSADFSATLAEIRERKARHPRDLGPGEADSAETLARRIRRPDDEPPLPEALLAHLAAEGAIRAGQCMSTQTPCIARRADVDADGHDEVLLCTAETHWIRCAVFGEGSRGWDLVGRVDHWQPTPGEVAAVRAGEFGVRTPRFQDLQFGEGTSVPVMPERSNAVPDPRGE